jgi:hypothetical protein
MFAHMTRASNAYLRNPSMGVRTFEQELSNAIASRGTQRQGGANGQYQAANVQPLVFDAQANAWQPAMGSAQQASFLHPPPWAPALDDFSSSMGMATPQHAQLVQWQQQQPSGGPLAQKDIRGKGRWPS